MGRTKEFLRPVAALAAAVGVWAGIASPANATLFTGSGTAAGNAVSASADFTISGSTLTIVLKNTSGSIANQDVPGSTLSGLFFDLTESPTLTPSSATASGFENCSSCLTNVDGEWGFEAGGSGFPNAANYGVASSGYLTTGLPGDIGNFNNGAAGTDQDGPPSLDGINFGIISSAPGFDPNGGLAVPLIKDSVTLILTGVTGLDETDISNVSFQYGTGFDEDNIPGSPPPPNQVPAPGSLSLLLAGLAGLRWAGRRRRRG